MTKFRDIEKCMNRAYKVSTMRKLFHRGNSIYAAQRASELQEAFDRRYRLACAEVA